MSIELPQQRSSLFKSSSSSSSSHIHTLQATSSYMTKNTLSSQKDCFPMMRKTRAQTSMMKNRERRIILFIIFNVLICVFVATTLLFQLMLKFNPTCTLGRPQSVLTSDVPSWLPHHDDRGHTTTVVQALSLQPPSDTRALWDVLDPNKKSCGVNDILVANGTACIPSLRSSQIRLTISSKAILSSQDNSTGEIVTATIKDPTFIAFYAGNESRLLYRFNMTGVKESLVFQSSLIQNRTVYQLPNQLPLGVYSFSFEVIDSLYFVVNGLVIEEALASVISMEDVAQDPKGKIGNMSISEIHKVTKDLNSIPNSKKEQVIDAIAETFQNFTTTLPANEGLQMVESLRIVTNDSNYVSKDSRYRISEIISRYSNTLFTNDTSIVSSQTMPQLARDLVSVASNIVKLVKNQPIQQAENRFMIKQNAHKAIQNTLSLIALHQNSNSEMVFQQRRLETENFLMILSPHSVQSVISIDSNTSLSLPSNPLVFYDSIKMNLMGNISYGLIKYENDEDLFPTQWKVIVSERTKDQTKTTSSSPPLLVPTLISAASPIVQFRPLLNGYYQSVNGLSQNFNISFHVQEYLWLNQTKLNEFFNNETLVMNTSSTTTTSFMTKRYKCYYWNETLTQWLSNGCETFHTQDSPYVICSCDHTTRFSAFVEFSIHTQEHGLNDWWSGIALTTLIIDSLFLIMISLLVIVLMVWRKSSLVKSRYLTPYLALSALWIESLMSGVISKSLLLKFGTEFFSSSSSSSTVDIQWMSNISSVISTSLYASAVWCYMIMSLRYLMHRYFYEWMMKALEYNKKDALIKYLCILKRQSVLIISSLVFGFCIALYFSIFVILRGVQVLSNIQFTQAASISLFLIMLFMTFFIVAIYVADVYLDFTNKQIRDELVDISEEMILVEKEQQQQQHLVDSSISTSSTTLDKTCDTKTSKNPLVNLLTRQPPTVKKLIQLMTVNDKLMFRAEVIFFFLGMSCFIVSYGIGFSTIDLKFSSNLDSPSNDSKLTLLDAIGLLFEILMTIFFIAAFGGFAWISSVVIQLRNGHSRFQQLLKPQPNNESHQKQHVLTSEEIDTLSEKYEIYKLLKNRFLLKIFRQYCKLEMSLENYIIWMKIENAKKNLGDLWCHPSSPSDTSVTPSSPGTITNTSSSQEIPPSIMTNTTTHGPPNTIMTETTHPVNTDHTTSTTNETILLSSNDLERWNQLISELTQWYHLHIQDHAEMGVNISGGARRKFMGILQLLETSFTLASDSMRIEKKTLLAMKEDLSSALENVTSDIIYNLLDTYARFIVSEEYKLVKEIATEKERLSLSIFK
ncbi:hypothetical protein C9374_009399 [Naegleria lovaniensis]|uniref:GAIN-B domain-containing protein n=1 Tax=Naegleria lovaniensis TaxID=51637 RepID=A0AA88KH59_NAELO|nr:uncharacterized protein C9374_009399 [Naegleria lovaniensis]KAG2377488.1 hypothetical protein C9374_009399 [Naegleria lovaniensis]